MQQNAIANATVSTVISDHVAIKKMRMIRKLTRKESALIFSYSRSSIEKVENGRGKLTPERVRRFVEGYGFTQNQFMDLKLGRLGDVAPTPIVAKKVRIIEHVEMRRSYKKIITKEVRTLAIFRKRKGVTQYEASRLCGWCSPTIGHIEQGRIELTEDRIKHIVAIYGRTMKEFYESIRSEIMRDEVEAECAKLIQKLDDNRLLAIKGILENF
jgi:transcriptional regulator with XRE-family HTH domain